MKVRGYGQQDRIKVALTRQDLERLWAMAQMLPGDSSTEIVEVRLVAENDYEWEIPEPPPNMPLDMGESTETGEEVALLTNSKWHLPRNRRKDARVIRTA